MSKTVAKRRPPRNKPAARKPAARKPAARKRPAARKPPRLRTTLAAHLGRQADDVWGLVLIVLGLLAGLGIYADLTGPAGGALQAGAGAVLGLARFLLPVALCGIGAVLVQGRSKAEPARAVIGFLLLIVAGAGILHLVEGSPSWSSPVDNLQGAGGYVGVAVGGPLRALLGVPGAAIVLVSLLFVSLLVLTRTRVRDAANQAGAAFGASRRAAGPVLRRLRALGRMDGVDATAARHPSSKPPVPSADADADEPLPEVEPDPVPDRLDVHALAPMPETVPAGDQLSIDLGPAAKATQWRLPPLQLLRKGRAQEIDHRVLDARGRTLEEALAAHGVETRLLGKTVGPTVTRYELELGPGVKVARVTSLQKDMAYALAAPDIRLLAPIPGRSAIGVEVPNVQRQLVSLGDILGSEEAHKATHPLEVAIGRDIAGRPVLESLASMPHILIAGATGAGKSSCLNSFLTSILMRATPDQVRMILVDPKRVELGQYNGLPHLLTAVVVNPRKAANALSWAVQEMERRTNLLSEVGVRDITGYNAAYDRGELKSEPLIGMPEAPEPERLPFVLVVVDELNDLMMVAARDVEESICRIAQMGRAFGIHLVIATQRPSVDVITGVIKANIPSRLAFAVSSLADSRVILDQQGAERLVGQGDMLLLTASSNVPRRIQGPWVSEEEVNKVVAHWRRQAQPNYVDGVEGDGAEPGSGGGGMGAGDPDDDDMLEVAMELVVRSQLGSTSMLQRKLRVGFARAGRLMDLLEQRGVVGPSEGSKARAVLMTVDELEQRDRTTAPA
ncbi:MAG TPA: DNA translocase FtsK 4TM domain-containing protein [Acidimicrobiales bacterium]|nr:DNA translocase FtsK 4TM domain-containing protein [Acidimicrobiales bacterium]